MDVSAQPVEPNFELRDRGETPFRIGALEIFPGFRGGVEFDDNIFLTRTNEENDTIGRYTPSVSFVLPFAAASNANASVAYDIFDYSDNSSEDHENLSVLGQLNLERIFGRFYSRTEGGWLDTSEVRDSETESAIGTRRERTLWNLASSLGYGGYEDDIGRVEVNVGYSEERFDRSVDKRLNEDVFQAGALVEYRITAKTSARVEYGYERNEFNDRLATDQRDDSDRHFVRAGVAFAPGALITGRATFGVERREFDDTITPTDTRDRDATGFSADVDLIWRARPSRTTIRGTFVSFIDTAATTGEYGYRAYRGEIGVSQVLFFISERLTADASYSLEKDSFLRSSRDDTIQAGRVSLTYRRMISTIPFFGRVSYEYAKRNSNVNVNDYTNNIVGLFLGIQY